ncbi:MAG: hypothetical protein JSV62_00395 [Promethearchaeota archaeon]|nr:MAG: hypothetical protein JSV62_00395 [Candidatus Lokiarchaeota archaeon]
MKNLTKNKIVLLILGFIFGFSILTNSNFSYYQGKDYGNLDGDTTDNNSQENKILKSNNGGINLITPENKTYYKPMSGYYPGTNSFDSVEVGTEPAWFQEVGTDGGTVQVIEKLDGHNTVLELYDTDVTNNTYVRKKLLSNPQQGTIEFWMRTDNLSKACGFYLSGGIFPGLIISLETWVDTIKYWDGADWKEIWNTTIQNDKWCHVRLDFECTPGEYEGLAQYTWQIFINGNKARGPFPFINNKTFIGRIEWFTDVLWGFSDYYYYIDAIAFSWNDRCNIADNMNDGLLLKFQAPSDLTWIGYSLNRLDNITIFGETAIPKPGNGLHSIQVFGKDSGGTDYSSELRYFEVANPTLVLMPGIGNRIEEFYSGITDPLLLDWNKNGINDIVDYYGLSNILKVSYYDEDTDRPEFDGIVSALKTSIKVIANAVKNYIINEFNAGTISRNIDLLCWSYGGLIVRTMIKEHYNELKDAGITIIHVGSYGTPNHGTWFCNKFLWLCMDNNTLDDLPAIWHETAKLNMYTLGKFLEYLNSGDETPYDIYYNTYRSIHFPIDPAYLSILLNPDNYVNVMALVNKCRDIIDIMFDGMMTTESVKLSGAIHNRRYVGPGHIGITNNPFIQKDILWDFKHYPEVEIEVKSPKNQTYYKPMDGYYLGTNSFDHDEIGCQPAWFLEVGTEGGTVQVIEKLDGHNTVLELYDTDVTENVYVQKNIPFTPSNGTVEFWMRTDNATKISGFNLKGGFVPGFIISVVTWLDTIKYWNSTDWIDITTIQSNKWYHIRIDFECTGGNYSGLAQYTWCLYINGLQYGNFPFINDKLFVGRIEWFTDRDFGFSNYHYYIDAIGFSWDNNYNVADNRNEGVLLGFDKNFEHSWISYSLDGGAINMILGNKSIPLLDDGTHSIQVFSEDWSGEACQSEVRYFSIDTSAPEITIISPNQNDLFGIIAPSFELSIIDPNLDDTWYTLDDGMTNITFTGLTLTINQAEWDKKSNGTVGIRFYTNDSWGYEGFVDITLRKDAYIPDITINSPISNERFGRNPPEFNISIFEEDLVSSWYTIEGIAGNFYFTEFNGTIDQVAWDDLSEGEINITFYAVDRAGNEGFESVMVLKKIPSRQAISSYNLIFLFAILSVLSIIIGAKIRKYSK